MYSPNSLFEGLDSILLILNPKSAILFIASSKAPGLFDFNEKAKLTILDKFELDSLLNKTNLVQLPGTSLIGKANSLSHSIWINDFEPIAALNLLPLTMLTASDVEFVGSGNAFGRFSDNHSEHWAKAWGWDNTSEMFESSPSLINACLIGKTIALFIKISGNFQRAS